LAENEVSTTGESMSLTQLEETMLQKYNTWVHIYVANEVCLSQDKTDLTVELLMVIAGKAVNGSSLWRKWGEVKCTVVNHMNTLWKDPTSGMGRADVLHAILLQLWNEKEEEAIKSRQNKIIAVMKDTWSPKEWFAFVNCGAAAEFEVNKLKSLNGLPEHTGDCFFALQPSLLSCPIILFIFRTTERNHRSS
jgi:hypothetical protein